LVDAPCSGQGVIGKHPDIKWRRSQQEIKEFSQLQKNIITNVSPHLDDKGQLVYSTCSIDKEENQTVLDSVLNKKDTGLVLENISNLKIPPLSDLCDGPYIKTFPHKHNMDGSFSSLIKHSTS